MLTSWILIAGVMFGVAYYVELKTGSVVMSVLSGYLVMVVGLVIDMMIVEGLL